MDTIAVLVLAIYAYLATGFLFALWFVTRGVHAVDEGMHRAPWGVRLLLLPSSVLLWPVLLKKYIKAKQTTRGI